MRFRAHSSLLLIQPLTRVLIFAYALLATVMVLRADSAGMRLTSRPPAAPYLNMPATAAGPMPRLLSQTGAFKDTPSLQPSAALIPYDINVAFWSDGAQKLRWISLPNDGPTGGSKIHFTPTGEWGFPKGTVFVKHFELPLDARDAARTRRLETRLVVCDASGSVYGVTYKWRADNSDAELLSGSLLEPIPIATVSGIRTQTWYYPSREDCRACHTDRAGGVLGVKTRQMNRVFSFAPGQDQNQIAAWSAANLFDRPVPDAEVPHLPRLAAAHDPTAGLELRARSYLDANCAQCHRPGGTVANFDARFDTPLPQQELIRGPVLIDQGIDNARVVAPNDIWRSILVMRMSTLESFKMPPLAHEVLDQDGLALLKSWIQSMPGPRVLEPPKITPPGGHFPSEARIEISHPEPGTQIHYSLDGSVPDESDPLYEKPIRLAESAVVRAKAFKSGLTKSITSQQIFVVE